jgi:hypothetical protein
VVLLEPGAEPVGGREELGAQSESNNIIWAGEVQISATDACFFFNGRKVLLENPPAHAGAALLAAAGRGESLPGPGEPPYLFCGNGACRDCALHVDGIDDAASCVLPLEPWMSFRPGEGAGEENALSRRLRALDRERGALLDVPLLIVGAGLAGVEAFESVRSARVDALLCDSRADRGGPRPVSVREGLLAVAEGGMVRPARARAIVLATGARRGEPQLALAKALGCRTRFDRDLGYERLVLDEGGETSVAGVFAAGDAARVGSEEEAIESGRRAGELAAALAGNRS